MRNLSLATGRNCDGSSESIRQTVERRNKDLKKERNALLTKAYNALRAKDFVKAKDFLIDANLQFEVSLEQQQNYDSLYAKVLGRPLKIVETAEFAITRSGI